MDDGLIEDAEWLRKLSAELRLVPQTANRLEAIASRLSRYEEWLAEIQMNAHKWMEAHDKLKAGKPYDLPKPADLPEAIERLRSDHKVLEAEIVRLQNLTNNARAKAKRAGRDMLREEADKALPGFSSDWEPLRVVAERVGAQSAAWLACRARDLQRRGLVESRWIGAERTSSYKEWRLVAARPSGGCSGPNSPRSGERK